MSRTQIHTRMLHTTHKLLFALYRVIRIEVMAKEFSPCKVRIANEKDEQI